jgi:DNA-directed RNA polymerase subunit beta
MIETPYAKVKNGKVTKEIVYLNALEEENFRIAHAATSHTMKDGNIVESEVEVRINGKPDLAKKEEIDYIDVATNQAFSVATSLIPFLNTTMPTEH